MRIQIFINTNHNSEATYIEQNAIHEFTGNSFVEGTYEASVTFECLAAYAEPTALRVLIEGLENVTEIAEDIQFWFLVCKNVISFLKKCHGYNKTIEIEKPNRESEIFDAPDDMTDVELQAKILYILDIEQKKLGKEVRKILDSDEE